MTRRVNGVLVGLAVLLVAFPLVMGGGTYKGTDDQAKEAVMSAVPDYKPWAAPFWEPPSPEIASLLFALQAALGAGVLGYILGYRKGQRSRPNDAAD
jgi:cobalt/nickel transport protein